MPSVLFVVTGADQWILNDGSAHPTGFWAEELAVPHRMFREAGYEVTVSTPNGVKPTVDANSLTAQSNGGQEQADAIAGYLEQLRDELAHPVPLEKVSVEDFDAVFYPGGHGPMQDLAVNEASGALLTAALDSGKPLAVLCHAPAALLAARRPDGSWPFAGYRMTGFSNAEEQIVGFAAKAPWLLEDRLVELGADYHAGTPFTAHTESDRNLFTGQNPGSSRQLAETVLAALRPEH